MRTRKPPAELPHSGTRASLHPSLAYIADNASMRKGPTASSYMMFCLKLIYYAAPTMLSLAVTVNAHRTKDRSSTIAFLRHGIEKVRSETQRQRLALFCMLRIESLIVTHNDSE